MRKIQRIGVAGAGTMGHGIAQVFAQGGFEVYLLDQTQELVLKGISKIKTNLQRAVENGKLPASEMEALLSRIHATSQIQDFQHAHLAVEAIAESLDLKAKFFQELDTICPPETLFASNTSSLSITKLASFTKRPERFIGLHFMNPPPVMTLVEVIRGQSTSHQTMETVRNLCLRLGKTPVEAHDFPGFIANRILMPMINEAILAYMQGVGTKEAIDTVMKLGMNHPMGPLELADFIGLDVCLAILQILYEGFGDSKYKPCPLLRKMVEAGQLGRKTKKGFYDY